VEGFSLPDKRSERVVLEANLEYWDKTRLPQVRRIVFDHTLAQKDAVELVKTTEGQVDIVSELSPLDTLRVAQSPFAKIVKNRGALMPVVGQFNTRKPESPWNDVRLRQAANFAINREDVIRYAAKGNGVVTPALLPAQAFGYDPTLAPYPFDPVKARQLLQEAGYPQGLPVTLIAQEDLVTQATVVGKMLEQVGFQVDLQILEPNAFNQKTFLSYLDRPPEQQTWDIAMRSYFDEMNFPIFAFYHDLALDGAYDWVSEAPELRQLYTQVLQTVHQDQQRILIHQMERHTSALAYFLFLYNPIQLYAVNKNVAFVPYVTTDLILAKTSVAAAHWSVRKQKTSVQE
jgi:peptide/nickel transport system substrate-binding protein